MQAEIAEKGKAARSSTHLDLGGKRLVDQLLNVFLEVGLGRIGLQADEFGALKEKKRDSINQQLPRLAWPPCRPRSLCSA